MLALVVGTLFATATYLILRRNMLRLIFGLIILGNAVNLLIFTVGRVTRAVPPLIPETAELPLEPYANPLPQALILTAIVISFGLVSFALVLLYRSYQTLQEVNSDKLANEGDPESPLLHIDPTDTREVRA